MEQKNFDPDGVGVDNGTYFGLPFAPETAELVLISAPWDVTLCSEPLSAEMTRRHNDANMLAMGGGLIGNNMADRIVDAFLNTPFEGGRHQRRVDKIEG